MIAGARKSMLDPSKTMLDSNVLDTAMLDPNKTIYFQDNYFCQFQNQAFHLQKRRYSSISVH